MAFQPDRTTEKLVSWLREHVGQAGAVGVAAGISGGIDSAVVAGLAVRAFPDNCLGLVMPCHSHPDDEALARDVAATFRLPIKRVDLGPTYDTLLAAFRDGDDGQGSVAGDQSDRDTLAYANLKPRLRMTTVYYWANRLNYLVVGTGNRAELTIGYFTKHGDGGVDLLPLGELVKEQVRDLARYLGVPAAIIERPPSAGLWEGQTDENEMGLTYAQLDQYLLTGEAQTETTARIERLRQASEHKRRLPPVAPL